MEKNYQPEAIEKSWYQHWEANGYFQPSNTGSTPYCIMIPPPNVTGTLHMGHAFQDTIMDALTRYHRMLGDNTLWQPGTDHAGIATQMVVERRLNAEGTDRHELGRDAFIDKVWEWKEESGGKITQQLRRMGASVDWERERFTMDEGLSRSVQSVFIQLYDEGLIYRGKRLVNWDPVLHTAISDLEVESEEENGHMWHMKYPLSNGEGHIVVATTRPETMLGDTAVAVNPSDERYQHLIGQTITLPITEREIPIIADDYVDAEFGSGCVKITPAHDFNDYEMGKRHQLPMINIFTINAEINEVGPERYQGLDRYVARKQLVAELDSLGLLEKVVDHKLMVPRCERSGAVVEPYLTDQWFVKTEPLAKPAIDVVKTGKIKFIPENQSKVYFEWMNNIQDWCISRQLWWGHRIPAWYDDAGNHYVAENEKAVREKYNLADNITLYQDEDVLDTWFSSALWPFSTLGWPEQTPALGTFYPTNVLVTGFDIIFFWVARMIMMGLKFMDDVPFNEVYVHGLVLDSDGQKMSKSKGNVLDPIDIIDGIDLESLVAKRTSNLMQPDKAPKIEKSTRKQYPEGIPSYGTDALRFSFAALATNGRDVRFDLQRIEGYRNFCNKLWNAARYVLMQCENYTLDEDHKQYQTSADRWIQSLFSDTAKTVNHQFSQYRFDLASKAMYEFIWNEYCDWYLELTKPVLFSDSIDDNTKKGTLYTLIKVLESVLRLTHPIMPFITEEIWQQVATITHTKDKPDTIQLCDFPQENEYPVDADAIDNIEWVKTLILSIRRLRSEMNIKPGIEFDLTIQNWEESDQTRYNKNKDTLHRLVKISSATWAGDDEKIEQSAMTLAGNMKLHIPFANFIDKETEIDRLSKEIEKIQQLMEKTAARLNNKSFVDKAPQQVVDQAKKQVEEQQTSIDKLEQQLATIKAM